MDRIAELQQENSELTTRNLRLETRVGSLESENERLREELRLALHRAFGKSSEKLPGQDDLPFEDLKDEETPESVETVVIAQHERRGKAGR